MAHFYFDASAMVKHYTVETGSGWVESILDQAAGNRISTATVTRVEVASALARKEREGTITVGERDKQVGILLGDCSKAYTLSPLSHDTASRAVDLTQRHPLRAYDAVQLGTALIVNQALVDSGLPALTFVCADDRLLEAAEAEGLAVDDPNRHP
jgi:predicted nucleic acid-binding protein